MYTKMPSSNLFNTDNSTYKRIIKEYNFQPLSFTRREIEILKLIKNGKTTKQIATELNISALTVKKHRENMMNKTVARNMTELIVVVVSQGLL